MAALKWTFKGEPLGLANKYACPFLRCNLTDRTAVHEMRNCRYCRVEALSFVGTIFTMKKKRPLRTSFLIPRW